MRRITQISDATKLIVLVQEIGIRETLGLLQSLAATKAEQSGLWSDGHDHWKRASQALEALAASMPGDL